MIDSKSTVRLRSRWTQCALTTLRLKHSRILNGFESIFGYLFSVTALRVFLSVTFSKRPMLLRCLYSFSPLCRCKVFFAFSSPALLVLSMAFTVTLLLNSHATFSVLSTARTSLAFFALEARRRWFLRCVTICRWSGAQHFRLLQRWSICFLGGTGPCSQTNETIWVAIVPPSISILP